MRWFLASLMLAGVLSAPAAVAESLEAGTDRLSQLHELLAKATWQRIQPGVEGLSVVDPQLAELHAYRLAQKTVQMRMLTALQPEGSGADQVGRASNAQLVINGGYFAFGSGTAMKPTGLLIVDGTTLWPRSGCHACSGVLFADKDGLHIDFAPKIASASGVRSALQVGPLLVHPGGAVGIRSAGGPRAPRSAVCISGNHIIVLAALSPLTLFELAKLLQAPAEEGGFGCERAINLDGGPSTQMFVNMPGHAETLGLPQPVQNFVAFFTR